MAHTILTVDDALFMRTLLRRILEQAGYQVIEASNGREGLEAYEQHQPDLVLMDVTMPDMDGVSATRAIREQDPQAKIVICSALGQQQVVVEATKAGAMDYIVKPFQAEQVLETVKRALAA